MLSIFVLIRTEPRLYFYLDSLFVNLATTNTTGYDVPVMSEKLDWIAVMAYDYHGQWDKRTGHVAPMYAHPEDDDVTFNTVKFVLFICLQHLIFILDCFKETCNIEDYMIFTRMRYTTILVTYDLAIC